MNTEWDQPVVPRVCFNWLPTYRYGQYSYHALQQLCALRLRREAEGLKLVPPAESKGAELPINCVRAAAIDSVLNIAGHTGYIARQFEDVLEPFAGFGAFYPLTEDLALIVAKSGQEQDLLSNVIPYMTSAPHTVTASAAVAGGYAGVKKDKIEAAHLRRKGAASELRSALASLYATLPENILLHSNAVGGIIEGTVRSLHKTRPGFKTCSLAPEYWDLMRLVLTYAPQGLRLVRGRDEVGFPTSAWLEAVARPDNDFIYLSFTSNPVGTTIPEATFLEALDVVPTDTLFMVDCTSVDTEDRSSETKVATWFKRFAHKNIIFAKSFSKEYDIGHLRMGYGLCTRPETARDLWPFMTTYPSELGSRAALKALKRGTRSVLDEYRRANQIIKELGERYPQVRFTGDCSNYTLVKFNNLDDCSRMKQLLAEVYGDQIYPGELPMRGGGDLGLSSDEIDIASMKDIPFLSPHDLRLVVTEEAATAFGRVMARLF